MPLNIRSKQAEELAGALAKLLDDIAVHCATLRVQGPRTADESPGCDEHGIPR